MSSSNTTETDSASTGANSSKAASSSETTVNESSSSDGKDLLHSLKGHVSFAKQCLGLLQNQMKHAMDTLDILQDQVIKAQSTIDKIERKGNKQSSSQKGKSVDYKALVDDGASREIQLHGHHHMIVIDSNGQPLYPIDKPGTSYSIPVQHQGPCLCSACTNGQPVFISGQDNGCIEKGQQIIAIHPGQAVYPIDDKQVASLMGSCQDANEESPDSKTGSSTDSYGGQRKRKCSCPSYVETSPKSEGDDNCPNTDSPQGSSSNAASGSDTTTKEINKSTSPIASQLLQVIDVLQNAGDDESRDSDMSSSSTRSLRSSRTSSTMPFTGPVPRPVHTTSGTGILAAVARRTRKQDMCPVKREFQSGRDIERELPELMKVPPPVLAATLEPDFLVVPGNSYFADSPPSVGREKERPTVTRDDKRSYERRSSRDSQSSGHEGSSSSLADVKKELIETMRSSSVSSMASEGSSRSPSESSISEKGNSRGVDEIREADHSGYKTGRRRSSQESIVRDKQKDRSAVFSPTTSHKHPNGDPGCVDLGMTASSSTRHARPSLLNSPVTNAEAANNPQSLPTSPKGYPTRSLKVTPLNSQISASELNEMRRSQSLEYTTANPGIMRISHATPMTSAVSSNQAKTDNPSRFTSTSSSVHSNDKITPTKNSFLHNSETESPDLSLVTTYSVAQISNDDARPPPSASPTKRPNILSRNRQGKKDIPQGIVVLVPTIEDAKQLIKSTGGNQANTPVLVPQNVLNQFSANGEASKSSMDKHVTSGLPGKRPHYPDSSAPHSGSKRRHNEPLVID